MSDGEKPPGPGVGKVVLIVVAVLVGLGVLCCGIGGYMLRDKIRAGVQFGTSSAAFDQRLKADFGPRTTMTFVPDDDGRLVVVVGVEGGPTPENLAESQDKAWRAYCEAYADGGMPVGSLGIGTAGQPGKSPVTSWRKNVATAEELAGRTGVTAPVTSPLFESLDPDKIRVSSGGEEPESEDTGK